MSTATPVAVIGYGYIINIIKHCNCLQQYLKSQTHTKIPHNKNNNN